MRQIYLFFMALILMPCLILKSQCDNEDFEEGTLRGWEGFTGEISSDGVVNINTPGIVDGRHTVMTFGTMDPIGQQCGIDLPTVDPSGYYSMRLGNEQPGRGAESIRKTFIVDSSNSFFLYKYAIVLEDPNHKEFEQPRFHVNVYDENGSIIPCGEFGMIAGPGATSKGFKECNANFIRKYWIKEWTIAGANLAGYMGKAVTIEFTTTDCSRGAHFGYAYIEASCRTVGIEIEEFCPGADSIYARVTEGFTNYLWNSGETGTRILIKNPVVGDEISVTVSSVTGCDTTIRRTLVPTVPPVTLDPINDTIVCKNSPIVLKGSGNNVQYIHWPQIDHHGPSIAFNATKDTAIAIFAYDSNGCAFDADTIQITTRDFSMEAIFDSNNCPQDSTGGIQLSVNGGIAPFMYQWDHGPTTSSISNVPNGTYGVTITDMNGDGCAFDSSFVINDSSIFEASISSLPSECANPTGMAIVTAKSLDPNNLAYLWENGEVNDTLRNVPAGTYKVRVYEDIPGGCWDTLKVEVTKPTIHISSNTVNPLCEDVPGSVEIIPHGGTAPYTYYLGTLASSSPQFQDLKTGDYWIKVEDAGKCADSTQVHLHPPHPISITFAKRDPVCTHTDGTVEVSSGGGIGQHTYSWNTGDNSTRIDSVSSGTFTVQVTDELNCTKDSSIVVNEPKEFVSAILDATEASCTRSDGIARAIAKGGTPPYNYLWPGIMHNGETADNLAMGYYKVIITDSNDCEFTDSVYVDQAQNTLMLDYKSRDAYLGMNTGSATVLPSFGFPPYTAKWPENNLEGPLTLNNVPSGSYPVTVTDSRGCVSDTIIIVGDLPPINPTNAFTPNADGWNDTWHIRQIEDHPQATVQVFTRWGVMVYETDHYMENQWDGTLNGKYLPGDTYYYMIDLNLGNLPTIAGYVDLIK